MKTTAAAKKKTAARAKAIAALVSDARYLRIDAKKDVAFRAWKQARHIFLVTKREKDRVAMEKADRHVSRVLRALQRFENAFLKARGFSW